MVWAAIPLDGRTDRYAFARGGITAEIHRNDILEPIVRPMQTLLVMHSF